MHQAAAIRTRHLSPPATAAPPSAAPPVSTYRSGTLVDVDGWRRWWQSRSAQQRWRRWAVREPALLGWTVDDLAHPVGSQRTDAMQAALVAMAQQGNGDAATTLLVQLRPGLIRLAPPRPLSLPGGGGRRAPRVLGPRRYHPLGPAPSGSDPACALGCGGGRPRLARCHRRGSGRVFRNALPTPA